MPTLGEKVLGEAVRREIISQRLEYAIDVRDRIRHLYYRNNHPYTYWWHYMWAKHPVWSWWQMTSPAGWANWSSVTGWCGYSNSYAEQVSYDYNDNGVYANGQEVQVDDAYSKQARELAKTGADLLQKRIDAKDADKLEWLPLGVYSLSDTQEGDPTMFLQLAISKEGIVAGTFFNASTNDNLSVQGGADRESTRIGITIGDKDDVVVETGLYNLTEEQSSALIHFEGTTRQNWTLVKMPYDKQGT